MDVIFARNKDRKTCNMFIDTELVNEDIPFIPSRAMDHRGTALWYYAKENNLEREELILDEYTEQPSEVWRAWDYSFNPTHVQESILEREQMKKTKHNNYYGKSTGNRS